MGKFNDDTNFLFADPSFVAGMAAAIDIGGTLIEYNNSRNEPEADLRAMASDWAVTGKDIRTGVEKVATEIGEIS
jgi:hypothetical protein